MNAKGASVSVWAQYRTWLWCGFQILPLHLSQSLPLAELGACSVVLLCGGGADHLI
jgi:hypothetical protein